MGFAFEHNHPPVLRQPETGGSAGNPAADDDEICLAHERLLWGANAEIVEFPCRFVVLVL
jgi:hypothetical protein